jgi:hypothetical protein
VKWARVLYRGVTQFQDYKVVEMLPHGDAFTAVIPAEMLDEVTEYNPETGALWDFMYLIEAMDNNKNGCITPDFEETDPYVFVRLPHKTIEETGGKVTPSRIRDKTYLPGFQGGPSSFRILSPVDNDVFLSGSDILVKMKRPAATNDGEVIELYIDGKMVKAEKRGDLEYAIKGLENGVYRIKALYNKERGRAQEWSNTVEIGVGQSRQRK